MKKREEVKKSLNMIMFAIVLMVASITIFLLGQLCDANILFVDTRVLNILLWGASIFSLVASIFELIDSITMRKINRFFRFAFICSILGIILSLSASGLAFLPENVKFIFEIIEITALFFETAVFFFYIAGIRKIDVGDGNTHLAKFGRLMEVLYIISVLLFYVLSIIIVAIAETNSTLALALTISSFAFSLFAYIVCFVFLFKSKKSIKVSKKKITN